MDGNQFIKAYCSKSKQYFALEAKQVGGVWKVINMMHLEKGKERLLATTVKQSSFETHETLLPCTKCGSRKVGGCSCAKKKTNCKAGMPYSFNCIYCEHLQIDYSTPDSAEVRARVGEKIQLSQGQTVEIKCADDTPLSGIYVGVGWDPTEEGESMDVDSSVVLSSSQDSQKDLIYFGNLKHKSGCILHHGDNLTGEKTKRSDDDENISVYLDKVPVDKDKLIFVLNIYECENRHQTLGSIKNLYIRLYDLKTKKVLIEYQVLGDLNWDTAMVIAMAYRQGNKWMFKAIGRSLHVSDVRSLALECEKYI